MNQNKLNLKLKRLIRQLGEAIHETVSDSDDIASVVKDIREEGYDVMLMLEATIGLNQIEAEEAAPGAADGKAEFALVPFNAHDMNFLRSLRITVDDEDAAAAEQNAPSTSPSIEASAETVTEANPQAESDPLAG